MALVLNAWAVTVTYKSVFIVHVSAYSANLHAFQSGTSKYYTVCMYCTCMCMFVYNYNSIQIILQFTLYSTCTCMHTCTHHTLSPSQVLLHRSASEEGAFLSVTDSLFSHDLFLLSWGPTVAALSYVFDNAEGKGIVDKAIAGFRWDGIFCSRFWSLKYMYCICRNHIQYL